MTASESTLADPLELHETPVATTATPLARYFTPVQWAVFFGVVLLGLVLRWLLLDMRPYHHDESLHGMYGRYFFDFPDQNFYKYDPMLHGPMLYNTMRLIYSSFGYSDYAARVPVAIFGSLFIFLPLLFRRFFTWNGTVLALTTFIALSPTLIYWSRFLREDYWVLLGMLLVLYGCTLASSRWMSSFVLMGISLNWCTKANLFVHAAVILGYLVFEYVVRLISTPLCSKNEKHTRRQDIFGLGCGVSVVVGLVAALAVHEIFATSWPLAAAVGGFVSAMGAIASFGAATTDEELFNLRSFLEVLGGSVVVAALVAVACKYAFPRPLDTEPQLRWLAAGITVLCVGILGAFGAASKYDFMLSRASRSVSRYPVESLVGLALALAVYAWFYTAGFRYGDGFYRGFYSGIEYWTHQHSINRIDGPFSFHVYHLSWYESIFMLGCLLHLVLFYWKAPIIFQLLGAFSLFIQVIVRIVLKSFAIAFDSPEYKDLFKKFMQIGDGIDFHVEMILLTHALLLTVYHIWRGERVLSFFGYLFTATFFTYCYLGEKVPWLSTYVLVAGLLYLPLFFESFFRQYPINYRAIPLRNVLVTCGSISIMLGLIFVLEAKNSAGFFETEWRPLISENSGFLCVGSIFVLIYFFDLMRPTFGTINIAVAALLLASIYNIRAAVQTNYRFGGEASEYISQVHTTYDLHDVAQRIRLDIVGERLGYRPKVLVTGEGTWPLTWYFRDLGEYRFSATDTEKKDFTYIIQDIKDPQPAGWVPEGYSMRKLNLRGWWVPDLNQLTLKRFMNYAINHTPWNSTGFSTVMLLTAKDTSRFRNQEP